MAHESRQEVLIHYLNFHMEKSVSTIWISPCDSLGKNFAGNIWLGKCLFSTREIILYPTFRWKPRTIIDYYVEDHKTTGVAASWWNHTYFSCSINFVRCNMKWMCWLLHFANKHSLRLITSYIGLLVLSCHLCRPWE